MSVSHTASSRPWSKRRWTRSGGNDAAGSVTVVRTLKVRGLMPAIPISAMIAATVFSFTVSPRSRSSVVIRGGTHTCRRTQRARPGSSPPDRHAAAAAASTPSPQRVSRTRSSPRSRPPTVVPCAAQRTACLLVRRHRRSGRCRRGRRTSPSDRTGPVLLHRGKVRRSFYQELVVLLQLGHLFAQPQQLGPLGRLQGLLPMDLSRGDPAPLVFDPDAQHSRVDPQLTGNLSDRALGIDHTMRSLDLVLGRVRPTLTRRHDGHPSSRTAVLLTRWRCPGSVD